MPDQTEQTTAFLQFIKEHRGDERYFDKLCNKLDETIQSLHNKEQVDADYLNSLTEVKEKQAEVYKQTKEKAGSAWPEFEKFVTELERAATASLKE
jgi:hypothetical protein